MKQLLNIFTAFICTILAILLYLIVTIFLSIIMCQGLISEKGIQKITDEVDILQLPATGSLNNENLSNETIKDVIVSKITSYGVSEVLALKVLEDPKFDQIINQFLIDYSKYMLEGKNKPEIDQKAMEELIIDSRDLVKQQTGYVIPDSQVNELLTLANDFASEIDNSIKDKEDITNNDFLDEILSLIYSDWFKFISICIIVLILLLFMLLRYSVIAPLIWGGISFIASGSTLTLIAILKTFITNLVNQYDSVYTSIFKAISSGLFKHIYFYGIGVLLLGITMVIVYSILKKKLVYRKSID